MKGVSNIEMTWGGEVEIVIWEAKMFNLLNVSWR